MKKITLKKVEEYGTIVPLLSAMYAEFKDLSSKKPESVVSKSKIAIVNRLLSKLKDLLADESTISYLDLIDEEMVPQMSDVTLMLSQYVAAIKQFTANHQEYDHATMQNEWVT